MEIIATVAGVITSLGMIFGMIFAVYKWFLKQEKHSAKAKKSCGLCKSVKRQGCESAFAVIANIVLQRTDTAKSRLGVCRGLCG